MPAARGEKRKREGGAAGGAPKEARIESGPPWTGAEVRRRLLNKEYVYGTCVTSTSPKQVDAVVKTGVGLVFIDTEHVPIVRDTLSWMCQLYDARGVTPLVRVPEPEPYRVAEYLDAGARGIVAPYIETVAQARMLVGATKLRPLKGELLDYILERLTPVDPKVYVADGEVRTNELLYAQVEKILRERGDPHPEKTTAFMKKKCGNNFLMLNIESVAAVGRLEDLAAFPGVDGFQVGPHDLSCNYGVPEEWESAEFHGAIDRIIEVAEKYHIACGIHYAFAKYREYQIKWGKAGARLVLHSNDIKLFVATLKADLAHMAESNGDPAPPAASSGEADAI
mmetsp:Transcript_3236/g.7910  ORF Transcript_3236/g.7910 Transcript_3236/m.7910 type:complete len:338 (+) Transcript_3236:118-1131(+)